MNILFLNRKISIFSDKHQRNWILELFFPQANQGAKMKKKKSKSHKIQNGNNVWDNPFGNMEFTCLFLNKKNNKHNSKNVI